MCCRFSGVSTHIPVSVIREHVHRLCSGSCLHNSLFHMPLHLVTSKSNTCLYSTGIKQTLLWGICYKWANSPASYTWEGSNLNHTRNVIIISAHWRSSFCMSSISCNISCSICQIVQWKHESYNILWCEHMGSQQHSVVYWTWRQSGGMWWYNKCENSQMAHCGVMNMRAVRWHIVVYWMWGQSQNPQM